MPSVETQFPATAEAPQSARAFLRAALQTWQLDGFGQVTELLTDELVANVVRHVGSPLTLRATTEGATLRIEVDDPSTEPPVLRHPDVHEDRGRGILLVDALATQWGAEIHSDGKTVWFEIDVSTATEEIHGSD
jgi:anti-sigma regulatory factor (Ser/Thr protein kinase)